MREETKAPQTGTRLGHKVTIRKLENKDGERTHPVYRWRATFIENGKRRQKGFKTKTAAENWAEKREEEAKSFGVDSILTAAERSAVIDNRERLAALGVDLRAAIEFAADYYERARKSCTVAELVASFTGERERSGKSERYLADIRSRLGRFEKAFGERPVATVTREEIADWLHALKLSPVSRNNFRRLLVVLFNDAIEGGFIEEGKNPAAKVKTAKEIETEVGILSPSELSTLIEKADETLLPAIVIGAFAGVRDAEIKRLDWADIDLAKGFIRIRAGVAKSARNRLIPISDNLAVWLQSFAQASGPVWPRNGRKLTEATRRAAGFGKPGTETEEERENGVALKPWPDNALRHSFASYHLAKHQNADELALHMGHRGTALIFAHYRALVTPEEAETFWSIAPEKAGNVVEIREAV